MPSGGASTPSLTVKLHNYLNIRKKSAWHLAHRLHEAFSGGASELAGPVEVDEVYMGGDRRSMPKSRRKKLDGRGTVGKSVVVRLKDRGSNQVRVKVVRDTTADTLQGFICMNAKERAMVYTDEHRGYRGLALHFGHKAVNHGVGEHVQGQANTHGMESFWCMLKRSHKGALHKVRPKHLDWYVTEFSRRHSVREDDTLDGMACVVLGMVGKRLLYSDHTADNGLENEVRL